jgi:hypothetical protein
LLGKITNINFDILLKKALGFGKRLWIYLYDKVQTSKQDTSSKMCK